MDAIGALVRRTLADLHLGRTELGSWLARPAIDIAAARARWLAACGLAMAIGIAGDDYRGFEDAVAAIVDVAPELRDDESDESARLIGAAGELVARQYGSFDDPALPALAERIVEACAQPAIDVSIRACAALAVLSYYDKLRDLEKLLWLELAMRPVLADAALGGRLRDEWQCAWVNALYLAGDTARSEAARHRRSGASLMDVVQTKQLLLDAQIAIGDGAVERGRTLLGQVEPLLDPARPHQAAIWHFLASRLAILDKRLDDALVHARLGLRLGTACGYPERWMGLMIMQEGQVQLARGAYGAAVPFFERAGRSASGMQADYCWCLAHFARALGAAEGGDTAALRAELAQGFALARRLEWQAFLRANAAAASALCTLALEHGIETEFVRAVIAARHLDPARPDLAAWPWPVRVRTLGRFAVEVGGTALALRGKAAHKPLELLQFVIACGGQQVSSASVEFALWPDLDGDNAHAASKVAVHRLRRLLGDEAVLVVDAGRLSLNPHVVWADSVAFEALADALPGAPFGAAQLAAAQRALSLYTGPFLGSEEDHAWQVVHRERLASKHRRIVLALVAHARAHADAALLRATLERALELDPLEEELVRELMQALGDAGEYGAALGRYERWHALSARSLGVEPAPATLAMVQRIRAAAARA
ncbi:MAG: AfsR/SARP family transcriptional regulator [Caldimonas sp.]